MTSKQVQWIGWLFGLFVIVVIGLYVYLSVLEIIVSQKCERAGYSSNIILFGDRYCAGFRDGRAVIVPLSELGGAN